jgi:hypothetical protein
MNRQVRNVLLFIAATLGTALLSIGVIAVMAGDPSGWRGVIGGVFAFAFALAIGVRSARSRRSGAANSFLP